MVLCVDSIFEKEAQEEIKKTIKQIIEWTYS